MIQNNQCPYKKGRFELRQTGTEGRQWEDRKEAASWTEWCSHKPRNTKACWQHQKLEEERKDFLIETTEGAWPCAHLDLECLAFRTGENKFLLLSAAHCVIVCYNSLRPTLVHRFFCCFTWIVLLHNNGSAKHGPIPAPSSSPGTLSLSLCAK